MAESFEVAERQLAPLVQAAAALPGVLAISLGGSVAAGLADASSDFDLHVYWRAPLATDEQRAAGLAPAADPGSVVAGVQFWGLEDHLRVGGRPAELVYVNIDELRDELARAYGEGLAAEGFATALLYSAAQGRPLHDPQGQLAELRARLASYPEPTRQRLMASHPTLLRAYLKHLRTAQVRGDLLFVQHRRYTVQMVWFNALFALNRRYHPGEKRLLAHAAGCPLQPHDTAARWEQAARLPADDLLLAEALSGLVEDLCALIEETP